MADSATMNATRPLAGLHAVVTGGGSGIGLAIAQRLSSMGTFVTLLGRDRDRLARAVDALGGSDAACAHPCDVRDAAAVHAAFDTIAGGGRHLAILVNNAGVARSARLPETTDEIWSEALATNLTGTFLCTRAAMPALLRARAGRVVNVASTAGLIGYAYVSAYCAAKHGVVGLTRALALEFAGTPVTVNAVCPGYTETDIVQDAVANIVARTGRSPEQARDALAARNPQKRLVTPDEVASAVAWLCLPESQSITGQALPVAGGEVTAG